MATGDRPDGKARREPDDDIIPLADFSLHCASCGREFTPTLGETVCSACVHVAPPEQVESLGHEDGETTCPSCNYPLRGLSAGSRCPECGWSPRTGKRPEPAQPAREIVLPTHGPKREHMVELPTGAARRRRERAVDDLVTRGVAARSLVTALVGGALLSGLAAGVLGFQHWWAPWILDDWSIVLGWGLFTLAAVLLSLPGSLPAGRVSRWFTTVAIVAGTLTTASMAAYPLTKGVGGIALQGLWDLIAIVTALSYIIALIPRLNAIVEYAGQDPSERGFISSSGPFILGVFTIATGVLLTWFFRRKLDFADAFSIATATWLVWRTTAILWHVKSAARTRSDRDARERRRAERGPGGTGSEAPAAICAVCGHSLRDVPARMCCPECGGYERA